jgi:hypothetical protein
MGTDLVKYGSYSLESADEEQKDLDSSKGADFMKLSVGRNVVRFLPPKPGVTKPFRVIHQHYLRPPGSSGPVVLTCPRMEARKHCPICEEADRYKRSGNPADRDRAYELFPSRRVFANVIDRKDPEAGPKVLAFGKTVHEALIAIRKDDDAGGDFTNPNDGFDIIIEREGTGATDTKYKVLPSRKQSPLGDLDWIEKQHDLERMAQIRSAEEIAKILSGEGDDAGRKPPKDVTPKPPRASKSSRSAEDDIEDAEVE